MIKIIKKSISAKYTSVGHFYLFNSIFAAMIVVFSITFLVNDYVNFKSDIVRDVKWQNERIKQKFTDSLLYTKHIMRYIGKQVANHGEKDYKFINNIMASYRIPEDGIMSWSTFSWANKDHKIVISSNLGIMKDWPSLADRDYIPLTTQHPEVLHLGKMVNGAVSGLWSIPLGYGVVDTHRKYIGAVVTGIVIENLKTQIEKLITNRNIFFAIIDLRDGIITKSSDFDSEEQKIFLDKFLQKIKTSNSKKLLYKTGYYQQLDEYPYGIITVYNNKMLISTAEDRFVIYLGIISLIIAFSAFIFYGFHKNLISPIIEVADYAKKIYHGEPDRKIPQFEVSEINDLAKTLSKIDEALLKKRDHKKNE